MQRNSLLWNMELSCTADLVGIHIIGYALWEKEIGI